MAVASELTGNAPESALPRDGAEVEAVGARRRHRLRVRRGGGKISACGELEGARGAVRRAGRCPWPLGEVTGA